MTDTTEFSAATNKPDNGLITQTSRILANVQRITSQPSFQRSFPAVIAVIAVGIGLLVYALLQQPERTTLLPTCSLHSSPQLCVRYLLLNYAPKISFIILKSIGFFFFKLNSSTLYMKSNILPYDLSILLIMKLINFFSTKI